MSEVRPIPIRHRPLQRKFVRLRRKKCGELPITHMVRVEPRVLRILIMAFSMEPGSWPGRRCSNLATGRYGKQTMRRRRLVTGIGAERRIRTKHPNEHGMQPLGLRGFGFRVTIPGPGSGRQVLSQLPVF
jgi:hypothetical protein